MWQAIQKLFGNFCRTGNCATRVGNSLKFILGCKIRTWIPCFMKFSASLAVLRHGMEHKFNGTCPVATQNNNELPNIGPTLVGPKSPWKNGDPCVFRNRIAFRMLLGTTIWGFPTNLVPNNHGFSYSKWSFWGVLGVPPFTETPIQTLQMIWFWDSPLGPTYLDRPFFAFWIQG